MENQILKTIAPNVNETITNLLIKLKRDGTKDVTVKCYGYKLDRMVKENVENETQKRALSHILSVFFPSRRKILIHH